MRKTVVSLAFGAAVLAFAAPAHATDGDGTNDTARAAANAVVHLDFDGDGKQDDAWVGKLASDPDHQVLSASVGGKLLRAKVPYQEWPGQDALRVVDVNGDGKQEVVVTETMGANTQWFSAWGLVNGKLQAVHEPGQAELTFYEGGGISAHSAYGCEDTEEGRHFQTVSSEYDWNTGIYTGQRITYSVQDGVATEIGRLDVTGEAGDPDLDLDATTCA